MHVCYFFPDGDTCYEPETTVNFSLLHFPNEAITVFMQFIFNYCIEWMNQKMIVY